MDGRIDGAYFQNLLADIGDEASIGGATAGREFGIHACHLFDRITHRIDQIAAWGEVRLARHLPLQVVFQTMFVEDGVYLGLQRIGLASRNFEGDLALEALSCMNSWNRPFGKSLKK